MMSYQRYQFSCIHAEIYATPAQNLLGGLQFTVTFSSEETFHDFVKRIARTQPDEQVKLAFYALETEMGDRAK